MRKVEEEVAWFDKYFFKAAPPENEAVKKDSPLFEANRRRSVQTWANRYGLEFPKTDEDIKKSGMPGVNTLRHVQS